MLNILQKDPPLQPEAGCCRTQNSERLNTVITSDQQTLCLPLEAARRIIKRKYLLGRGRQAESSRMLAQKKTGLDFPVWLCVRWTLTLRVETTVQTG